jgi:hypothetical protein
MNMASKKTPPPAWFRNPTLDAVIHRETVRERQARPPGLKPANLVYIASPYRGDTEHNHANAVRYCRFAVTQGKMPVAPHIWLPQFLSDDDPAERR